jgi:hypothetical protein
LASFYLFIISTRLCNFWNNYYRIIQRMKFLSIFLYAAILVKTKKKLIKFSNFSFHFWHLCHSIIWYEKYIHFFFILFISTSHDPMTCLNWYRHNYQIVWLLISLSSNFVKALLPFMFLLVFEKLSGICGMIISVMQYVDDTLFIQNMNLENLWTIKMVL